MHNNNECLNFLFMSSQGEMGRVDAERKRLGWSWAEFARRVGETPQTVNNWKARGGVPGDKKFTVAQELGKTVEWLVMGDPETPKIPAHKPGESLLSWAEGKVKGRKPVYPPEPFNKLASLAKLWPYLTDESQNKVLKAVEELLDDSRHGMPPPTPPFRTPKKAKEKAT